LSGRQLGAAGVVPVAAAMPLAASALAGLGWLKRRRGQPAAA
jgi:hypothetical protein